MPRRLSLRTRLLVLLLGVTAIILLVMGTVSTFFFRGNLTTQFNQNLVAMATRNPSSLTGNTRPYLAVQVTFRPFTVSALTSPSSSTTALTAIVQQMGAVGVVSLRGRRMPVRLPQAGHEPSLLAAARVVPAAQSPDGRRSVVIVARPVSDLTGQIRGFIISELATGAALMALLAIGGEWLIGAGLDPLDQMAVTASEITSRGDLTARMPDASDGTEVGRLGSAINTMLDRIQQAFGARQRSEQRVREFAADASHELRTPLTTIRGYAELYRQGALGPDQLPSAMRRIEQEAQRMGTLVAELLELARLDRTSSLDLTESDLAGVVRDAVADAVAVEPGRPVRAEAPPRLVAVVDERRIRQVLANLLSNVRAHTPVSTPVAVRLGQVTGGVLIEVADAGPGMSGEDAARAFDRFHRAAEQADSGDAADGDAADGDIPGGDTAGGTAGRKAARMAAADSNAGWMAAADSNAGPMADADSEAGWMAATGSNADDGNDRTEWAHGAPSLNGHGAAGAAGRASVRGASHGRGHGTGHGTGQGTGYDSAQGTGEGTDPGREAWPAAGRGSAGRQPQVSMRERGSTELGGGGSGLGLSIVQAIAAAHGGQATLESWPGRGTRVRIWLPTRTAPPASPGRSIP